MKTHCSGGPENMTTGFRLSYSRGLDSCDYFSGLSRRVFLGMNLKS